jgi:DNA-binding response OmpR family regulator
MTTSPARILIVDDEPFNVDYLEQELADLGYLTASARNGQEALEAVAATPPDLVLLDVMMPVMDGFEVCRRLKESEDTRLIPVIIMTALGAAEDRIRGIRAGADDFLTKPVDPRELLARIETSLRQKQAIDRRLRRASSAVDQFARFVPEAVRRLVDADPDAPELGAKVEQDLSVLFLDISEYSRLSERLPAGALNELVEGFFSACLLRIQEGGGDINETAGDGFMAIFQHGDPARHAVAAANAALCLRTAAGQFRLQSAAKPDPVVAAEPLRVHIGLNSGVALVGATRLQGRHGGRWTFTASGQVTNLAARLAAGAGPGEILVGPQTAAHLSDGFELEDLGPRQFKNLTAPVPVHRLLRPLLPAGPAAGP